MVFRRRMRITTWLLGILVVVLAADTVLLVMNDLSRHAVASGVFALGTLGYLLATRASIGLEAARDAQLARIVTLAAIARHKLLVEGRPYDAAELLGIITTVANPTGEYDDAVPMYSDLQDPRFQG